MTESLTCVEWCNKKIKEASENADLESFEAYTELLKQWTNKKAAIPSQE